MIGTYKTHNLLLTNRQVAGLIKAFAKILSKDIELSITQLFKIAQSDKFFGRLLGTEWKFIDEECIDTVWKNWIVTARINRNL